MKEQLKKNFVRPLLPLGFSSLLLVVLLCGLSQGREAEAGGPSAAAARERNRPGLLDYQTGVSVCKQTENLVPNPGFEQGGGEPWKPDHWREAGDCFFSYDYPGPDGGVSARIFAGSSRDKDCRLRTTREEIPVEPGRFYDYSASVKADLLEGDAYLRITFWSWQGDHWEKEGEEACTTPVMGIQEPWIEVTGSVQAPADAEYAMVEAILPKSSLGSVWFDDVFLGLATCLDISKSDDPDPVEPGQMLTYTIVYSNTGREKATDVEVIETYDDYVDFEWAQPPPLAGTENLWKFSEVPAGDSDMITVVVQVAENTEERAWLFNKVWILSKETEVMTDPVHYIERTAILSDGCAIYLDPTHAEKLGEPGHHMNYGLTLGNVGSFDGQVDLVASSSQSWDVITPSLPYTLSSGDFVERTVSPFVPEYALSSTVDVTTITATLVCGPPSSKTAIATGTLTTTVGLVGSVVLAPDHTGSTPPGEQVIYIHTLTNDANVTQTVTLTACSSCGYTVTVEPTTTGSLAPWGGLAMVTVTVRVLGDVLSGTDATVVTATGAVAGQDTITDATTVSAWHVYLPLVLRSWPFILVPELYSIENADGDGSYIVCWSAITEATGYVLEEATNSAFTDATVVYDGPDTCYSISGKGAARYYYHVKACNSRGCSGWSNVEWVDVLWEHEPNNSFSQANGPLISGLDYYGYHGDEWDCFKIDVRTAGQITVDLTNYNYTGEEGVQLLLYYESPENRVKRDWAPPYHIEYTGPAGQYYIVVYTESGHNPDTPYTLRTTFP